MNDNVPKLALAMTDEGLKNTGKQFMEGALAVLAKYFMIGLAFVLAFTLLADWQRWGMDGTDDRETGQRSGMALRTDHGTGCQYLESAKGGITPRLDRNGKHYCN